MPISCTYYICVVAVVPDGLRAMWRRLGDRVPNCQLPKRAAGGGAEVARTTPCDETAKMINEKGKGIKFIVSPAELEGLGAF